MNKYKHRMNTIDLSFIIEFDILLLANKLFTVNQFVVAQKQYLPLAAQRNLCRLLFQSGEEQLIFGKTVTLFHLNFNKLRGIGSVHCNPRILSSIRGMSDAGINVGTTLLDGAMHQDVKQLQRVFSHH